MKKTPQHLVKWKPEVLKAKKVSDRFEELRGRVVARQDAKRLEKAVKKRQLDDGDDPAAPFGRRLLRRLGLTGGGRDGGSPVVMAGRQVAAAPLGTRRGMRPGPQPLTSEQLCGVLPGGDPLQHDHQSDLC